MKCKLYYIQVSSLLHNFGSSVFVCKLPFLLPGKKNKRIQIDATVADATNCAIKDKTTHTTQETSRH